AIAVRFDGAKQLAVNSNGDLIVRLEDGGELLHQAPTIYQLRNGRREKATGKCALRSRNTIGFDLATYDHNRAVYIDPGLVYSTYLGGTDDDGGFAIAVDSSGNAYVTGGTTSVSSFPTTSGAYQKKLAGTDHLIDAFVTKLNVDGSDIIYST